MEMEKWNEHFWRKNCEDRLNLEDIQRDRSFKL